MVFILALVFIVQFLYIFKQQQILLKGRKTIQNYICDIIEAYNKAQKKSGNLLPELNYTCNVEQFDEDEDVYMYSSDLITEYQNVIEQFYNNLDTDIIGKQIIPLSYVIQLLYQITQNIVLLQQINKSIGQVFPIHAAIAQNYQAYDIQTRKKIYDGEQTYLIPYIFVYNGFYYGLLTDANNEYLAKIKSIDSSEQYQALIKPNCKDNKFQIQNLDDCKICSYPNQRYTNADQWEEDDEDEVDVMDQYYINNTNNIQYDQNDQIFYGEEDQEESIIDASIYQKDSNGNFKYNFTKYFPQHQHKDLVRNVLMINDVKEKGKQVDLTSQDYMNVFTYHTGGEKYSSYPVLIDKDGELTQNDRDYYYKLDNKNSTDELFDFEQGQYINNNSNALPVGWYVCLEMEEISDQDKLILFMFEQGQVYIMKLMKYLTTFRYIDQDKAWELLFNKIIPDIQGFLKKQYSKVYEEKLYLDKYFEFYSRDIQLSINTHQQNIYYKYYKILEDVKKSIIIKCSKQEVFKIVIQFLNMFYLLVMHMNREFYDTVISSKQFTIINNKYFNKLQDVVNEIHVDSTLQGFKHYKMNGKKVNMSKIKLNFKRTHDFKIWEIQLIYDTYLTFYTDFRSIVKIFLPSPTQLFKNQFVMKIIYLYLTHDFGYYLYNIICSDQFVQVLCELLRIFNSDKKQQIVSI